MDPKITIVPTLPLCLIKTDSSEERENKIKDILSRGKIVVFRNSLNGIEKHVDVWNLNEMGDLMACYSSGLTKSVCWTATQYEILEATI